MTEDEFKILSRILAAVKQRTAQHWPNLEITLLRWSVTNQAGYVGKDFPIRIELVYTFISPKSINWRAFSGALADFIFKGDNTFIETFMINEIKLVAGGVNASIDFSFDVPMERALALCVDFDLENPESARILLDDRDVEREEL